MRTAAEILNEHFLIGDLSEDQYYLVVRALNKARVETIKECAEAVLSGLDQRRILKLIDQVK